MTFQADPTEAATAERAFSLVNGSMWMVVLQRQRIATDLPEDEQFIMRPWMDWELFVIVLWRLRQRARIATHLSRGGADVLAAVRAFDGALPDLKLMRDVAEHIDEYAVDSKKRHHTNVSRRGLQVGSWSKSEFAWRIDDSAGSRVLNADTAVAAAEQLFTAVRTARDHYRHEPGHIC